MLPNCILKDQFLFNFKCVVEVLVVDFSSFMHEMQWMWLCEGSDVGEVVDCRRKL